MADRAENHPTPILTEKELWPSGVDEFGFQSWIAVECERGRMVVVSSCEPSRFAEVNVARVTQ